MENLKSMTDKTKQQIREELMQNPDDKTKFHAYIDKVKEEKAAFPKRFSPEEVEKIAQEFKTKNS